MEKKKCVQCGKEFILTDSEKQFFENKNLKLPKRCKECRDKNNSKQLKTDTYPVTRRNERTVSTKKSYLIFAILLVVFSLFYFNNKNGSEEYNNNPKINVSDSNNINIESNDSNSYIFKSESLLQEHFDKHGSEFGYDTTSQYESGASAVINSPDVLHKIEAEDGDSVYYIQATNEFVILSTDGYIRTYFKPEDGIDYYNRQ